MFELFKKFKNRKLLAFDPLSVSNAFVFNKAKDKNFKSLFRGIRFNKYE